MTTNFGWSLPPGCRMLPGEEMLPPCCEDCEEEGDNPDCIKTCKKYKKFLEESEAADNALYGDFFEGQFTYEDYTGKGD